ncbi:hypothetical protein P7K49_004312, partial [Saguinus oedipus]
MTSRWDLNCVEHLSKKPKRYKASPTGMKTSGAPPSCHNDKIGSVGCSMTKQTNASQGLASDKKPLIVSHPEFQQIPREREIGPMGHLHPWEHLRISPRHLDVSIPVQLRGIR